MSDMYVELMSRIPMVAARTHLGKARIQEAQDAKGLSNERIARLIPVSEKTWRRWKDAGEIPTYALPAVANALGLEIRGAAATLDIDEATLEQSEAAQLRGEVRELRASVESLLHEFQKLRQALAPARRASGS